MYVQAVVLILLLRQPLAAAQDYLDENFFVNPPPWGDIHYYKDDPVWRWGSGQSLQWHSTWPNINIKLYQNDNYAFWIMTPDNFHGKGAQTFEYNSTFPAFQYNMSLPSIFFFRINNVENDVQGFNSHYFNLTNLPASLTTKVVVKKTTSTTSTTSVPTSSAPSTTSTAQSTSPIRPPVSNPKPIVEQSTATPGLSTVAQVGMGVGIAVAVIIAVGLLVGLFYYRRKAQAARMEALSIQLSRARFAATEEEKPAPPEYSNQNSIWSGYHMPHSEMAHNSVHYGGRTPRELP